MEVPESMIQEDEVELFRQEIPVCTRVATSNVVVDCILFRRKSYPSLVTSTGPLAMVDPVEDPCGAEGDDRIPRDSVLSNHIRRQRIKHVKPSLACSEEPNIYP